MKRIYYKSKWRFEDLNEKSVRFTLTAPAFWVEGVGIFCVHIRGDTVSIDIAVRHPREGFTNLYHIFDGSLADKIEPHPDKTAADFRLVA